MAKFIAVMAQNPTAEVIINIDTIIFVRATEEGGCKIITTHSDTTFYTATSYEDIKTALEVMTDSEIWVIGSKRNDY